MPSIIRAILGLTCGFLSDLAFANMVTADKSATAKVVGGSLCNPAETSVLSFAELRIGRKADAHSIGRMNAKILTDVGLLTT